MFLCDGAVIGVAFSSDLRKVLRTFQCTPDAASMATVARRFGTNDCNMQQGSDRVCINYQSLLLELFPPDNDAKKYVLCF